jgi:hypothetical protein
LARTSRLSGSFQRGDQQRQHGAHFDYKAHAISLN